MAGFFEGAGVVVQACTLVIGLPTVALVLTAARRGPLVAAAAVPATATMMWAKAGGYWTVSSRGWVAVPVAVLIAGTFIAVWKASPQRRGWLIAAAAVTAGMVAGWNWQPCVGTELGDILHDAAVAGGPGTLGRMLAYTVGALMPAVVLAALPEALPGAKPVLHHPLVTSAGLGFGLVYAAAVLSGRYSDLVGELYRISSA